MANNSTNSPGAQCSEANSQSNRSDLPYIDQFRTLGSGAFSMKVTVLGFDAMGMNHDRGAQPTHKSHWHGC